MSDSPITPRPFNDETLRMIEIQFGVMQDRLDPDTKAIAEEEKIDMINARLVVVTAVISLADALKKHYKIGEHAQAKEAPQT